MEFDNIYIYAIIVIISVIVFFYFYTGSKHNPSTSGHESNMKCTSDMCSV